MIGAILRNRIGWLLFGLAEFLGGVWALTRVLPDDLPLWLGLVVMVAFWAGLTWVNLRLARRYHVFGLASRGSAARETPDV